MSQTIKLTVKFLSGSTQFSVDVPADASVAALKKAIQPQASLAPEAQKIIFSGRILKDEDTLEKVGSFSCF